MLTRRGARSMTGGPSGGTLASVLHRTILVAGELRTGTRNEFWPPPDRAAMHPRARAALFLVLGVGVRAALLAYVGPAQVVRALHDASPAYLALAVAAYALFFLLR